MQLRVVLIVSSLLASVPMLGGCSSAVSDAETALYYPPPVNFNPSSGLLPALTQGFDTGVPSSPPFRP